MKEENEYHQALMDTTSRRDYGFLLLTDKCKLAQMKSQKVSIITRLQGMGV
jgi:hypothetical protein